MQKRKRPHLYIGELASGAEFYFYRRPCTSTPKRKPPRTPSAEDNKAPSKRKDGD